MYQLYLQLLLSYLCACNDPHDQGRHFVFFFTMTIILIVKHRSYANDALNPKSCTVLLLNFPPSEFDPCSVYDYILERALFVKGEDAKISV